MDLNHYIAIKMASETAARAHLHQVRKDRITPFIVHPARVSVLVSHYRGSSTGIIAAWMHDIIEDCDDGAGIFEISLTDMPISSKERKTIQDMVDSLTKDPRITDKHERLMDSVYRIRSAPPEATLVKICDRIDNLIDARSRDTSFIQMYLEYTDDIIETLGKRASQYGYSAALEELVRVREQIGRI